MTLSDLESRDSRSQIFPADLCNYARTLESLDSRSQIFPADLCNYARTIWLRTIKFGTVTCAVEGPYLRGQPHPGIPIFADEQSGREENFYKVDMPLAGCGHISFCDMNADARSVCVS